MPGCDVIRNSNVIHISLVLVTLLVPPVPGIPLCMCLSFTVPLGSGPTDLTTQVPTSWPSEAPAEVERGGRPGYFSGFLSALVELLMVGLLNWTQVLPGSSLPLLQLYFLFRFRHSNNLLNWLVSGCLHFTRWYVLQFLLSSLEAVPSLKPLHFDYLSWSLFDTAINVNKSLLIIKSKYIKSSIVNTQLI